MPNSLAPDETHWEMLWAALGAVEWHAISTGALAKEESGTVVGANGEIYGWMASAYWRSAGQMVEWKFGYRRATGPTAVAPVIVVSNAIMDASSVPCTAQDLLRAALGGTVPRAVMRTDDQTTPREVAEALVAACDRLATGSRMAQGLLLNYWRDHARAYGDARRALEEHRRARATHASAPTFQEGIRAGDVILLDAPGHTTDTTSLCVRFDIEMSPLAGTYKGCVVYRVPERPSTWLVAVSLDAVECRGWTPDELRENVLARAVAARGADAVPPETRAAIARVHNGQWEQVRAEAALLAQQSEAIAVRAVERSGNILREAQAMLTATNPDSAWWAALLASRSAAVREVGFIGMTSPRRGGTRAGDGVVRDATAPRQGPRI